MTPTPPTTSSTNQPIGSRTGTAKSLIVKGRLTCPSRSPQGGDRVVEPDHGTRQDRNAGQGRRPVGDEHAQRQQQDVDEVDQGLAAKAEDRDPGCHGLLKVEREGDEDQAQQDRCRAGDRQVELAPLVELLFEAHRRS
jgi:hypothetical protein